jgi:hypothetical protein
MKPINKTEIHEMFMECISTNFYIETLNKYQLEAVYFHALNVEYELFKPILASAREYINGGAIGSPKKPEKDPLRESISQLIKKLRPLVGTVKVETKSEGLTNKQKALLAVYNNDIVTRSTHGNDVYNIWLEYNNRNDRLADPGSKRKYTERVKLFEAVLKIIPDCNKTEVSDDLKTIEFRYKEDYLKK